MTDEEMQKLLDEATPGPWHSEAETGPWSPHGKAGLGVWSQYLYDTTLAGDDDDKDPEDEAWICGIWGYARLNDIPNARLIAAAPAIARELLEARALLADCDEYLKEGETPRQRMDRDHKDVLALMEMLATDRKRRDEAEAANGRYLYLLKCILKTAKQGHSIATQVWIEAIESTLKGTTK